MKKYIYILCVLLTGVFASCSQSETGDDIPQSNQVILQVAADQGLNTRTTTAGVDRFVIEVYTDATYTIAANVFTDGTNKMTSSNGSFSMVLDKTQEYHCLLWADKAGADVYDITSLKTVTLKSGKAPVEAWQGKLDIAQGTNGTLSATLKRAVAKITLLETKKLKAGILTMTFDQNTKFDVSTGATSVAVSRTETINIAAIDAAVSAGSKINANDIFVLASTVDAEQSALTFQMTGETDKIEVSNVPLKANYNTNIKGHYSKEIGATFTITCDDAWGTPDNDGKVTESSPYTSNVSLPTSDNTNSAYYRAKILVDGSEFSGLKLGTVLKAGTYTTATLPLTGNVNLSFYAVGQKNMKGSVKITVNNGGTIEGGASKTFKVQGNYGATGNSPYTITFVDSDFFAVDLQGVTAATTLTIETLKDSEFDGRAILTGINVK